MSGVEDDLPPVAPPHGNDAVDRFDAAIVPVDDLAAERPLPPGAGMSFDDEEHGQGRIAFLVEAGGARASVAMDATEPSDATDSPPSAVLVVELSGWSVAAPLTSGQLHRLINGLAGRGRRNTVRPLAADERHVHLTGTPERLLVEYDERTITISAGPKRGLSKVLRAFEAGSGTTR